MSRFLGLLLAILASAPITAADIKITKVSCAESSTGLVLQFDSDRTIEKYQKPEQQGSQLIVRFVDATVSKGAISSACKDAGITITYEKIRQFLVFRIKTGRTGKVTTMRDGPRRVYVKVGGKPDAPISTADASKRWKLDVIVIDAGHGGKDPGAKGVNGALEKTVTLQLAKKLKAAIKKAMPGTKVVMTRETDKFVELYKRTEIANKANGKLFVSIHCNSMPKKPHPANGCETYILRPGRNEDAARVASRENAVVKLESSQARYKSMTEDQIILSTMAQRSFVRFSEELAAKIQKNVSKATGLKNRGVNQAGFYVLVGASMPNVLFETAFISNTNDAKVITSKRGQDKTVSAMVKAIKEYAAFYKKSLSTK